MRSNFFTDTELMESIIRECQVCYVGMADEDNTPYVVPFNFAYDNGSIYLHSAHEGRKMDILKKNNRVCVTFSTGHELRHTSEGVACSYSMKYKSVMAFGHVEFMEDFNQKVAVLNKVMMHYTGKEFNYSAPSINEVAVYRVVIEKMTGKKLGY
jgi:nitroimidazol reductase NimA-like FMN-containing flavoprotein (pyridoxamine 5'-phosphate oxidase superfamily)